VLNKHKEKVKKNKRVRKRNKPCGLVFFITEQFHPTWWRMQKKIEKRKVELL